MRRIGLAVVLVLGLTLSSLAVSHNWTRINSLISAAKQAQQGTRVPRVGFILSSTPRIARVFANTPEAEITGPNPTSPYIRAFLQAMRELGWADGQNIAIERRSAGGRPEHWDALVQDLIKSKVDLIVITAPVDVVQKAEKAGNGLAIVLVGADPDVLIQRGLVKSIAKPGKNVTGLTNVTSLELREKRLQLLKEAAPKARRVAYLGA